MCVRVGVCERERERKRECVCVREREREKERERESVCERERYLRGSASVEGGRRSVCCAEVMDELHEGGQKLTNSYGKPSMST